MTRTTRAAAAIGTRAQRLVLPSLARLAWLLALLAPATPLRAQGSDVAPEAALFLLLPVGGRAISLGRAVVAGVDGSEAVWWNPSGLARQEKRELAIHHSTPVYETDANAISFVIPSSLLGVVAASVNILDFGTTEFRDPDNRLEGSITTTSYVFVGSYATAVGARLNAGINYKFLLFRVACSGDCPAGFSVNATSSAIDLGAQYDLRGIAPVQIGAAVRNLGPSLQVNDNPQRDPLPARLQVGARWRVRPLEQRMKDTELSVAGDVVDRLGQTGTASWHFGVDGTWRARASLRAGYLVDRSAESGASFGFGVRHRRVHVDLGYIFGDLARTTDADPVHVTVRYQF